MKKTLLALLAFGMTSVAIAQTHSILSGNQANNDDDGYTWEFGGTAANNCGPDVTLDQWGTSTYTWEMGPDPDQITFKNASEAGPVTETYSIMKMDTDDCQGNSSFASLEIAAPCTVRVACKASVAGDLIIHLNSTVSGNYAQGVDIAKTIGTTDYAMYDFVFTSAEAGGVTFTGGSFFDIEGLGFTTRFSASNNTVAGDLIINWIEVGANVGEHTLATSTTKSVESSSLVNVYPTPTEDVLNVDLTKLNADAELKLISSNGETVLTTTASNTLATINVAEFNAGLYALQITSEGTTTTKKVVIK
jgi:hypothetical protein